jgi:hypothetical protein
MHLCTQILTSDSWGIDTATVDYDGVYEEERHMFRLAAMAEKPIFPDS